ncbi:MAG: fluoride efflux transporter FluC [Acidimicrobiales bacterium]
MRFVVVDTDTGTRPRLRPSLLAAVALGGFLGTLSRYQVGLAWTTPAGHVPWATLVINVSGAALIGVLGVVILERFPMIRHLRPFGLTGLLGGWTTMSTLAVDTVVLGQHHHWAAAAVYVSVTLVASLAAVFVGARLTRLASFPPVPAG